MHEDTTEPFALPAVAGKKVTAAFDGGRITLVRPATSAQPPRIQILDDSARMGRSGTDVRPVVARAANGYRTFPQSWPIKVAHAPLPPRQRVQRATAWVPVAAPALVSWGHSISLFWRVYALGR
jgi:hypothetical protein